jgi:hypothetical protein
MKIKIDKFLNRNVLEILKNIEEVLGSSMYYINIYSLIE